LESVDRDAAMVTSRITWHPEELEGARKAFLSLAEEVRKKYQIKLKSLTPSEPKNAMPSEQPLRAVQFSGSAVRSGGGLASIAMLFVGLLLGGGMSIYFRDAQHNAEARFEAEKKKMLDDQRALADSMSLLHTSFADLVLGRSKPLPQLQSEMATIQRNMDDRIAAVNANAAGMRARLAKKMPIGNRLTRALDDVEHDRRHDVKKIEDEYKNSLRVYETRISLYKDLLANSQQP
jgi:hypothetical protein